MISPFASISIEIILSLECRSIMDLFNDLFAFIKDDENEGPYQMEIENDMGGAEVNTSKDDFDQIRKKNKRKE